VYSSEYTDIPKAFFTLHHYVTVALMWPRRYCCVLHHSCTNVIRAHFLRNNDPRSCRLPAPVGKTRQANRHGRAHKVFLAHVRAWRTRNNLDKSLSCKFNSAWDWIALLMRQIFLHAYNVCTTRVVQVWPGILTIACPQTILHVSY
jgi:hypothetical protein